MNCKICNTSSKHLENHHIIPKSRGGEDSESNLIKICSKCHGLAHDVSFSNDRGGLIKDSINRNKNIEIEAVKWMNKNPEIIENKMNNLYYEDVDKHMLMLFLLEKCKIKSSDFVKWCKNEKVTFKTSFTF